jgi:hypothetical protein
MSKYSSGSTLGPLSIALPEPSKIRPNISSETPSFRLCPVNSTFDYVPIINCSISMCQHIIPSSHQYQTCLRTPKSQSAYSNLPPPTKEYLYTCTTARFPIPLSQHVNFHAINPSNSPLASKTCPDLSEPSGRVRVTISLYLGNLTYTIISPSHTCFHNRSHSHSPI